jgi:hypothetical protein
MVAVAGGCAGPYGEGPEGTAKRPIVIEADLDYAAACQTVLACLRQDSQYRLLAYNVRDKSHEARIYLPGSEPGRLDLLVIIRADGPDHCRMEVRGSEPVLATRARRLIVAALAAESQASK